ncbi:hypothetical protein PTKIN_Ptkin03bG0166400 [Pterospermum kingtungense]
MKRKDVLYIVDDDDFGFLSRSRKFMRLDGGDLLSIMEEDPSSRVPLRLQNQIPTIQSNAQLTGANSVPSSQEMAIVLYNPSNTPFPKSPTSPDFSMIINSALFPGLKERLVWGLDCDSWTMKSTEDKAIDYASPREPNHCLAVVPWVAPQLLLASGTETGITAPLQPMEAEDMEGDMMDTDDNNDSNIARHAFQDNDMVEGAKLQLEQQVQKQHIVMPQLSQNVHVPVTW